MASNLSKFLLDLGTNPDKLAKLRASPEQTMSQAGLSEEEKAIVRSGDPARIRAAITTTKSDTIVVVIVVVVVA
jgi:hypothetical protein